MRACHPAMSPAGPEAQARDSRTGPFHSVGRARLECGAWPFYCVSWGGEGAPACWVITQALSGSSGQAVGGTGLGMAVGPVTMVKHSARYLAEAGCTW